MGTVAADFSARLDSTMNAFDLLEAQGRTPLPTQEAHELLGPSEKLLQQACLVPELADRCAQLAWRMVAIKKIEWKSSARQEEPLCNAARSWKIECPKFTQKQLTEQELRILCDTARNEAFTEVIIGNKPLRTLFFKWALRDRNKAECFMRFPATATKLRLGLLTGRMGLFAGKPLQIEPMDGRDVLTLPFSDGSTIRRVNILKPDNQVTLKNGWKTTVGEILKIFSEKNERVGNVEMLGPDGVISNWNCHELGPYNPATKGHDSVNPDDPQLFQILPAVTELSKEKLSERYESSVTDGHWVLALKASRHRPTMDIEGTHGYLEIALPIGPNRYKVISMSKYAPVYPTTFLQRYLFLGATKIARIVSTDENSFYSHRQHAQVILQLNSDETMRLQAKVRADIRLALTNNLVMQLLADSCANWALEVVQATKVEPIPKYFEVHALAATPSNPYVGTAVSAVRSLPVSLQPWGLYGLSKLLLDWRSMEVKRDGQTVTRSVSRSQFATTYMMQHPAHFIEQVLKNVFTGRVYYGHQTSEFET